ncbi:putative general negative regulator of transcription C16 [Sesamum alatum]|uniref:General negative regulator of transcription C16 n=1 Tax=Sesamum alatum TaxID=300844 RepID=A0AAE1Z3I6_9LAMI|nr:putative general negative regulator of transcription C16 [Sesamum alatum]
MSDEGEKTCPLCAEEMDLTDQQLKPCKCGYEICVWCWHHIMDMAEKDETEGRCPACRTPYNKEKIVGTTAKCERLVSEINVEKKQKSQKGKSKTSEGRKQLSSVRVIQRNLVYVVGLPLNFADEDLLQRREYFGQYGKVLKVSISRTATGAIQHFANSTCSVYITYSKEEEAVRCIQLVHGFVLDGRSLKACFGTTKYCHAWLRNMPCSNPDCLYLHEIGSQEDSFTKDEIISAYTRSRVQQITGSTNSMQRRSGNVLPPPADEYCNNSSAFSGKPTTKTAINTNSSATSGRVSPPNSSSGRSAALPAGASWGTRSSNNQPLPASTPCSNGPLSQKPDTCNGTVAHSKAVTNASQVSLSQSDTEKKVVPNSESTVCEGKSKMETIEPVKKESNTDGRIIVCGSSVESLPVVNLPFSKPHSPPTIKPPPNISSVVDSSVSSSGPASDKDSIDVTDGNIENVCSSILSMSIHENQQLRNGYVEHIREPLICQGSGNAASTTEKVCDAPVQSDYRSVMPTQVTEVNLHENEDDLLSFDNQRIKDPEIATNRVPDFSHALDLSKHTDIDSPRFSHVDGLVSIDLGRQVVDRNNNLMVSTSNFSSGHRKNILNNDEGNGAEYSNFLPSKEKRSLLGRYEIVADSGSVDMGESSIISNILSMDFDSWDESLTSPQNLSKLLGETEKQKASFGVPISRKIQNSSQSRFSFAREEEPINQVSDFGQSINYYEEAFKQRPLGHDFSSTNNLHLEKFVSPNGLPVLSGTESDLFASSHSHISSNKLSVSRSQISAPPGFSVPSRVPPPGFRSHERTEQILESLSGNHILDAASLLRNQYHTPSSGNTFGNGDIEFMDPAILAVGKGTLPGGINTPGLDIRSSFSPQLSTYEDARFQSLVQRSFPPHQDQRFANLGDSFSTLRDAYGIPSRIMEQTLSNNLSAFSQFNPPHSRNGITSNGQWDGWNEAQSGNNLGVAELLRTERLGFNKFYSGYEDSKIRMPSSGNIYNGTYGI